MNESSDSPSAVESFPRFPLISAAALVLFALSVVGAVQLGKIGSGRAPDPGSATIAERQLRFEDRQDGSVAIIDASSNLQIDSAAPGTNGFLRGTLRGLNRERKREGLDGTLAFRLSETRSGHLLLTDPATSRYVDLGSFGPTNAAVFAKLLTEPLTTASSKSGTDAKPT